MATLPQRTRSSNGNVDVSAPLAFREYWENIYQKELDCNVNRQEGDGTTTGGPFIDGCDEDDYVRYLGGDEWYEEESTDIADWIVNCLSRVERHPLGPYYDNNIGSVKTRSMRESVVERGDDRFLDFKQLPILDVGCGAGKFLARLARRGFLQLAGIDYSANAIRLARITLERQRRIWVANDQKLPRAARNYPHICLRVADLRTSVQIHSQCADELAVVNKAHECSGDFCICRSCPSCSCDVLDGGNSNGQTAVAVTWEKYAYPCICTPLLDFPKFPVLCDKGTFDVFCLEGTNETYVRNIYHLMPPKGLIFLTSCNCTINELTAFFHCSKNDEAGQLFEYVESLDHPCFTFGGSKGQTVASILLRRL